MVEGSLDSVLQRASSYPEGHLTEHRLLKDLILRVLEREANPTARRASRSGVGVGYTAI
jgi:hypothetical protein